MYHIDGDNDSKKVKRAKNAVNNALNSGKMKKPDKCSKCGTKGSVEAHHHKGYDEENHTNVKWLCMSCHKEADVRLRKKRKAGAGDVLEQVDRVDLIELLIPVQEADEYLTSKFEETPEGYLTGRAIITNIGVFPYKMEDGRTRWELRHPEDVLDYESIKTLKSKPFTNDHPDSGIVDINNVNDVQTGFIGDNIRNDSYHVSNTITITDPKTIQDARDGKRALSAGYRAKIEPISGIWLGVPYQARQREIRYNHVSLVDRGRAGDAAKLRFDNADKKVAISAKIQKSIIKEDNNMDPKLKTVIIEDVDYQAEPEVIKALKRKTDQAVKLEKEIETAKKDSQKIEAERDALKAKVDKLEKELETKMDKKAITDAVNTRIKLLAVASMAGVEVKDDQEDKEIQTAVILKISPKADLKDKSDEYLTARFDFISEDLLKQADADAENRQIGDGLNKGAGEVLNSAKVRSDWIDQWVKRSKAPLHQESVNKK